MSTDTQHQSGTHHDGRSLADLLRDLRDESTHLVKQEVNLVKAEVGEKVARIGRNSAYLFAGAMVAYSGVVVLLIALSLLLKAILMALGVDEAWAEWIGPMVIGLVVIGIGYALVQKAVKTIEHEATTPPERTMRTLEEDRQFAERKLEEVT